MPNESRAWQWKLRCTVICVVGVKSAYLILTVTVCVWLTNRAWKCQKLQTNRPIGIYMKRLPLTIFDYNIKIEHNFLFYAILILFVVHKTLAFSVCVRLYVCVCLFLVLSIYFTSYVFFLFSSLKCTLIVQPPRKSQRFQRQRERIRRQQPLLTAEVLHQNAHIHTYKHTHTHKRKYIYMKRKCHKSSDYPVNKV